MYFTAKTKDGDPKYKGCIGAATADNFEGPYEAQPPVLAPGKFAQMECPQVVRKNDKVYLFFQSWENDYSPEWKRKVAGRGPQSGLHCYVGESLTGPFEPLNNHGAAEIIDLIFVFLVLQGMAEIGVDLRFLVGNQGDQPVFVGNAEPAAQVIEQDV